jgi:hypothetical protein
MLRWKATRPAEPGHVADSCMDVSDPGRNSQIGTRSSAVR